MDYTREIILNVEPSSVIPVVRAKQGDSSFRFIKAKLMAGNSQLIPESGTTVTFREEKPDGTSITLNNAVVNNDGTITVTLAEQTTNRAGRCICDLCLTKNQKVLSTTSFVIDVLHSPTLG